MHLSMLLFGFVALMPAEQQPPPAQPGQAVIRTGTQEVLLDVIVRDRKGKTLRDLTPDEIEVYDEGTRQKVTGFRLVSGTDAASMTGETAGGPKPLDPLRQLRLVTLLFEGMDIQDRRLARDAAMDFLKQELEQNVLISVFIIDQRLHILQQFTNNRELLKQAINRATSGSFLEFQQRSAAIRKELQDARGAAGAATEAMQATPLPGRGSGGSTGIGSAAAQAKVAEMTLHILEFSDTLMQTELSRASIFSLMSLVKEQGALPGRKTVLYFTPGLGVSDSTKEQFRDLRAQANRAGVAVYGVDPRGVTLEAQNSPSEGMLKAAAEASASDATGASVNASVRSFEKASDSIFGNARQNLSTLATETGGVLIADTNDLRGPLQRIREDVLTFYEVSYAPQSTEFDGRFHKLLVKVNRPGVRIQARAGYFALPPNAESVTAFETPLLHALDAAELPRTFPFYSGGLRFWKMADARNACAVVVEVPHSELTFVEEPENKRHRAHISFIAVLKDQAGQVVQRFSRDLGFYAESGRLDEFKKRNFVGTFRIDLAPGQYTLETAVMDRENMKISARRSTLVISGAASGVALSSIAFIRNTLNAAEGDPNDPFQVQGKRVIPTLAPEVKAGIDPGMSLFFVVAPSAGGAEKPQLAMELIKDGAALAQTAVPLPAADSRGLIPYLFSLPFAKFPPGNYELKMTASQGNTQAEERATFVVQ